MSKSRSYSTYVRPAELFFLYLRMYVIDVFDYKKSIKLNKKYQQNPEKIFMVSFLIMLKTYH